MERARFVGTAKEAVLLALLGIDDFVPVRDLVGRINRKAQVSSIAAIYRALGILDANGFITESDPDDDERVITRLKTRKPAGVAERPLLKYRLTAKGQAMAILLRLGQSAQPISSRGFQKAANDMYAALSEEAGSQKRPGV
jgi:hypothetical protein